VIAGAVCRKHRLKPFFVFSALLFFTGCAHGPILYPNAHLKMVGEERAHRDIQECDRLAEQYVKSRAALGAAKSTAGGAAAGAIIGGAMGSVTGNLGRGAAIGAAGGAAAGLIRGAVRASQPSPVHKNFVDRCLREKGYEPIGWQ
jgi:outer membrane lipoprotein SlyB